MESQTSSHRRCLRRNQHMAWTRPSCMQRRSHAKCPMSHQCHHITAAVLTKAPDKASTSNSKRNSLASAVFRTTMPMTIKACSSYKPTQPTVEPKSQSNSLLMDIMPSSSLDRSHTNIRHNDPRRSIPTPDSRCNHNRYRPSISNSRSRHSTTTTGYPINSLRARCPDSAHTMHCRLKMTITDRLVSLGNQECQSLPQDRKVRNSSSHQKTTHSWWSLKRPKTLPGSKSRTSSQVDRRAHCRFGTAPNSRQRRQFGQTKWYVNSRHWYHSDASYFITLYGITAAGTYN